MKIFLISDVHTEMADRYFDPYFDYECLRFNCPQDTDVVILAGDVGEWLNGLEWAFNKFKGKEIIYIVGNHEYYDNDINIIEDMRRKAKILGIHLLENDSVIIDHVRFLGTTLWTNFNNYSHVEINKAWGLMNDYKYITSRTWWSNKQNREKALWLMDLDSLFGFDPTLFSPTVGYLLHKEALKWLEQQLLKPYEGKTVIVSHHAPSMRSSNNYSYASNLEKFIAEHSANIDLWCHGHVHESVDYDVSGVRIVSNPRGYPNNISSTIDGAKIIQV